MSKLFLRIKLEIARLLSRIFYWIYDPLVESQLGDPRDYEYFQAERRKRVENYLSKYLGPRL